MSDGPRALAVVLTGAVKWVSPPRMPREGDTKRGQKTLLTNNTVSLAGCSSALAAAEHQAVVRTEGGCVSLPVPLVSAGRHPSARRGKDHAA